MPARTGKGRRPAVALLVASAVAGFAVLLVGGYAGHWRWTGFTGHDSLWDWLNLLVPPAVLASLPPPLSGVKVTTR
jgi:hypothetical protein